MFRKKWLTSEDQFLKRCKITLKYEALHAKIRSGFYIFCPVIDKEAFFRLQGKGL